MPEQRRSSRGSPWLLIATVGFFLIAVISVLSGGYWFALSQAGFAATTGLLYTGAEERGGAFKALLWASLAVAVVGGIANVASI